MKTKRTLSILIIVFIIMFPGILSAQTGTIKGKIIDVDNKDEIIGAAVMIPGTGKGASTDIYGTYIIENVPEGEVKLDISFISYKKINKTVTVNSGEVTTVNAELEVSAKMLNAVEVVEERTTHTEKAVVMEVKQAKQVSAGISKQQMAQSQDNSAAEAMKRIPGVTVIDNRFVMIRGINSRYNSVMINNVMAPSTEVNRRAFSFDLISSGALDRMMIYKSGAAENPGDFAGGVIKLYTNNSVDEEFTSVSLNTGYRSGTTFENQQLTKGSETDFLGFDQSYRPLPDQFHSRDEFQELSPISDERKEAAHSLPNNFSPVPQTALPDYGVGFSLGRNYKLSENTKLSQITSVDYSVSHLNYNRSFDRYFEWEDRENPIIKRFEFNDSHYEKKTRFNVMSNWSLAMGAKDKITFSNIFNQSGKDESILREGTDFIQRPNDLMRNYYFGYTSKSIYMGQIEGDHYRGNNDKNHLNWVLGGSYLAESEPDLRRFRTFDRLTNPEEGFQVILPPSSNLFETGRYYGDLQDHSVNGGVNYTLKLNGDEKRIKTGVYTDYRSREFNSRYFSYLYPGYFNPEEGERIKRLPINELFAQENIRTRDGLILAEGTRPIDSYTAGNFLNAAYASINYPLGGFDMKGGFRLEHNTQTMNSRDDFGEINVNNPVLSILPFMNISYNLTDKSLVRAGYGRTVNRPEFRELAPFVFYDYQLEAARVGNPDLQTATIDNLDLRYEYYPRPGETMSIGVFYKNFTDPIEDRTIIATEQPQFSYLNADGAYNYGAEIEIRKSLKGITGSSFLDKLSVNINAAIIVSQVDLGETAVAQDRIRPLQGQSPYILNSAIYYNNNKHDLKMSLAYNVFGPRIYSVGDDLFPTIYELERHSLDLTVSKRVHNRVMLKAGVQNLLDYEYRFYQDSNRSGGIDEGDHPVFSFKTGPLFTTTLTFDIHGKKEKNN